MPFECPQCHAPTLKIDLALELPASDDDDEVQVQVVKCGACAFEALAVYRENRRGALDRESWRHDGYEAGGEALGSIRRAIESCPARSERSCGCASHVALAKYNWAAVAGNGIEVVREFEMRMVR
jgi:ferredoxin